MSMACQYCGGGYTAGLDNYIPHNKDCPTGVCATHDHDAPKPDPPSADVRCNLPPEASCEGRGWYSGAGNAVIHCTCEAGQAFKAALNRLIGGAR